MNPALIDYVGVLGTSEIAIYTTTEALTAGDWVEYAETLTLEDRFTHVCQSNAGGNTIGVVLEDAVVGDSVAVCIGGYCKAAQCPIAGPGVSLQSGAGGVASVYTAASLGSIVGRNLTNVAAPGLSDVWIEKRAIII
jgi:hypothetical protein